MMMRERRRRRNVKTMGILILLALAYIGWLYYQRTLTGDPRLDGSIGVLLGLYICAHPAANLLDALLFSGHAGRDSPSWRSTLAWLALNLLVLFAGWNVIFIGTTRFVSRTP
jgi:hypothetical protein